MTICEQMDIAAKRLNVSITGGHSEVTPMLPFPIVVGCCMGITANECYVTSRDAKPGNLLILTKSVGLEGTAILAADRFDELSKERQRSTMHDPTEGGVLGGIFEMAVASEVSFRVFEEAISIAEETREICRFFEIDPLQLIASGSLLIAAERERADELLKALKKNGVVASTIGEFLPSTAEREIVRHDGRAEKLEAPSCDHLWVALEK